MTPDSLKLLIDAGEADRVERTRSTTDTNKFREAICAFSNDLPGYGKPGYLLIGVEDAGAPSGLQSPMDC
ncbi:AlbA family DNA-binding domain-containing protein [Verrucomicrobium spinosum]|uniref:AlbA family DNA-binding domain-containing protein n=1 Tax=Verrucomicrobium spinosum TaxID=2736 RepID=UPI000A73BFEA